MPYVDVVTLDDNRVNFEDLNVVEETSKNGNKFVYVKFWKPKGVVCTTDERIKNNIITELQRRGMDTDFGRVYPVGRLDKETHGLILVTNDGRLPNAALRSQFKKEKVYEVEVDYDPTPTDLSRLRSGIVITTVAQRDGKKVPLTAPTKPCKVEMISDRELRITLTEGRNRQIRRMIKELDLEVVELKRVSFMGIDGEGMRVGEWRSLDGHEMSIIESAIHAKEEEKKELRDWSTREVGEWVEKAGFPKYKESFLDSEIDGDRLLYLGTPDQVDHLSFHLAELGVSKSDLEELEENIVRLCEEEG